MSQMEIGVGTVVVCIKDTEWNNTPGDRKPYLNEVLTVREAVEGPSFMPHYAGRIFLRFVEFRNPGNAARARFGAQWSEQAFCSECFRPVKKTDISIFTKLLETPPLIVELVE